MKPRTRRALAIVAGLGTLGVAVLLVLNAFQSNLVFFFSPSQIAANEAPRDRAFRIGGLVEEGSIKRDGQSLTVQFVVTDMAQRVPVSYTGLLPDLVPRLDEHEIDLIILDVRLPDLSVFEVCRRLRAAKVNGDGSLGTALWEAAIPAAAPIAAPLPGLPSARRQSTVVRKRPPSRQRVVSSATQGPASSAVKSRGRPAAIRSSGPWLTAPVAVIR